jgi:hypothetical protein
VTAIAVVVVFLVLHGGTGHMGGGGSGHGGGGGGSWG